MLTKPVCALLGFAALFAGPVAAAAEAPPIFVGGQFIRQTAISDDRGHLLVPVRGIFEAFGANVMYTPPRIVVVRKNEAIVAGLVIGRRSAVVANRHRILDAAPLRLHGHVYVPLRAIAEIAGATVIYSRRPRLVDIRFARNAYAPSIVPHLEADDAAATLPSWAYALVALSVLAFLLEIGRRLKGAIRRNAAPLPRTPHLAGLPTQFPYAVDPGHQNGIGKIAK